MDLGSLPEFPEWVLKLMLWLTLIGLITVTLAGLGLGFWCLSHVHWK